ncbi:acyl-CoA carboxylase epsilon subunit [Amycolatopsis sp. VS8301801F10]|uniref:acyl-CoA carboxylase epsilon subunit n=1 Tax=Amycolatopsis sp. VS8301801F10 TaxID=2652442 RepID=UPI0038FCDAFE
MSVGAAGSGCDEVPAGEAAASAARAPVLEGSSGASGGVGSVAVKQGSGGSASAAGEAAASAGRSGVVAGSAGGSGRGDSGGSTSVGLVGSGRGEAAGGSVASAQLSGGLEESPREPSRALAGEADPVATQKGLGGREAPAERAAAVVPAVRVVRGNPDDGEVAALLVALAAVGRAAGAGHEGPVVPSPRRPAAGFVPATSWRAR